MVETRLWDFLSESGRNEIKEWTQSLSRPDQAKVEHKLNLLLQVEFGLLIHTNSLAGPIEKTDCIYKLRARGQKNIRLLLCKGPDPLKMNEEYTLLLGAIEPNRDLVPKGAAQTAVRYRNAVAADPENRRCIHEPVARTFERSVP